MVASDRQNAAQDIVRDDSAEHFRMCQLEIRFDQEGRSGGIPVDGAGVIGQ